jgi:hypothetical protein
MTAETAKHFKEMKHRMKREFSRQTAFTITYARTYFSLQVKYLNLKKHVRSEVRIKINSFGVS